MKPVIAVVALTALAAMRLARLAIGTIGLDHELGAVCAVIGAASLVLFRFTWFIRIGAFLALLSLWQWPWYAALVMAVPRAPMMIPGLLATTVAKWRHPRPLWRSVPGS